MASEDLSPPLTVDLSVDGFLGHESMRRGWGRGFLAGRLGHAHLVAGPEGIGCLPSGRSGVSGEDVLADSTRAWGRWTAFAALVAHAREQHDPQPPETESVFE